MGAIIKRHRDENGNPIYYITSSAAVGMSDGSGSLDGVILKLLGILKSSPFVYYTIPNKFLTDEGVESSASGFYCTDYISVSEGDRFFIKPKDVTYDNKLICYDASKRFVKKITWSELLTINNIYTVDAGISYIRCSTKGENKYIINIKDFEAFLLDNLGTNDEITEQIGDIEKRLNNLEMNNTTVYFTIANKYLTAQGVESSASGFYCTDYVSVSEGDRFFIKFSDVASWDIRLCAYNSDKQFVSTQTGSDLDKINNIYIVPSGISYIKVSVKGADKSFFELNSLEVYLMSSIVSINDFNAFKQDIESQINSLSKSSDYVYLDKANTYISDTGVEQGISGYCCSDFLEVKVGAKYYFKPVDNLYDYRIVTYNEQKEFVRVISYKDLNNTNNLFEVIEGDYYARFASKGKNIYAIRYNEINEYIAGEGGYVTDYITYKDKIIKGLSIGRTVLTSEYFAVKMPVSQKGLYNFDINIFTHIFRGAGKTGKTDVNAVIKCAFRIENNSIQDYRIEAIGDTLAFFHSISLAKRDSDNYLLFGNPLEYSKEDIDAIEMKMFMNNLSVSVAEGTIASISDFLSNVNISLDSESFDEITLVDYYNAINDISNVKATLRADYANPLAIKKLLKPFIDKVKAGRDTPFNLLYIGNSIMNFQNGWLPLANKTLPDVSNDKALCMYNTHTFSNRIWEYLNPGAMDKAGRSVKYGGNLSYIKATSSSVSKSGNWLSNFNYLTNKYTGPTFGGHQSGIKEFLISQHNGDYITFNIPQGVKGFSIVAACLTNTFTVEGGTELACSTNVKVELGTSVLQSLNTAETECQNKRFDYVLETPTTSSQILKITNTENLNFAIWGIEYWTGNCVRAINNGLAGNPIESFLDGMFDIWVKSYNPDLIIWEANLLNDASRHNVDGSTIPGDDVADKYNLKLQYSKFLEKCSENNYIVLPIITHHAETTGLTAFPEKCEDIGNWRQNPVYYPQYAKMLIGLLKEKEIPYLNVFQYAIDKYGLGMNPVFYVDGIHLSYVGHNTYRELIDYVFSDNY